MSKLRPMTGANCVNLPLWPSARVLHRVEQRVIEALHRLAAARRRGKDRVGNEADPEPDGERRSLNYR
jgi:hypothetical protein